MSEHSSPGRGACMDAMQRLRSHCDKAHESESKWALWSRGKIDDKHEEVCQDLSVVARYIASLERQLGIKGEAFRMEAGEMRELSDHDDLESPYAPVTVEKREGGDEDTSAEMTEKPAEKPAGDCGCNV